MILKVWLLILLFSRNNIKNEDEDHIIINI